MCKIERSIFFEIFNFMMVINYMNYNKSYLWFYVIWYKILKYFIVVGGKLKGWVLDLLEILIS